MNTHNIRHESRLPYTLPDLLNIALEKLAANDLISAFQFADRACRLNPLPDVNALLVRAIILFKRCYLADAISDLKAASLMRPGNHSIAFSLLRLCWSDLKNHHKLFNQSLIYLLRQAPKISLMPEVTTWIAGSGLSAMGAAWREGEFITGWAINIDDPKSSLLIELDGNFFSVKTGMPTPWLATAGVGNGYNGFRLKLPASFGLLRIGISGNSLWGCPFVGNTQLLISPPPSSSQFSNAVDIIVPVYSGCSETIACLDAIKVSDNIVPHRVIVVDDCSTDENLRNALRERAKHKEITLISRPINAGFAGAVNTVLALDNTRDVILLNADTLVFGNWLDRMRAVAYQSDDIGTVTPLSNHGELVSNPLPMRNNPVFDAKHAELIDQLFNLIGPKEAIDIPVGVGFCLYVKRKALIEVGPLDEGIFGRGYGEDTDFCLRIQAQGWRNVCAANTYVVHWGSRSFGDEKQYLVAQNLHRLHARYPQHSKEYEQFLAEDPLYHLRRNIQRHWLAKVGPQYNGTLHMGTPESEEGITFTLKPIERYGQWQVSLAITGITGLDTIDYAWPRQSLELREDLLAAGLRNLELKTFGEWPANILDFLTDGFIPYDVTLEDYSGYCPRKYRLIRNAIVCDDPVDTSECSNCVAELGPLVYDYTGITPWQERAQHILSRANKISTLNDEIRNAYIRRFPILSKQIIKGISNNSRASFTLREQVVIKTSQSNNYAPNPSSLPRGEDIFKGFLKNGTSSKSVPAFTLPIELKEPLRIAVLSARSLDEGYLQLIEQANKALEQQLAVVFIVLGTTMNDAHLLQLPNIHLAGTVTKTQIQDALRLHECCAISNFSPYIHRRIQVAKTAQHFDLPLIHDCILNDASLTS